MFGLFNRNPVNSVYVNDLGALLGEIKLIDIREPYEFKGGHLPTAENIPMDTLLSQPEKYMDKDKEYYIICQSGGRSSSACSRLKANGFNVTNVSGGTGSYRGALKK